MLTHVTMWLCSSLQLILAHACRQILHDFFLKKQNISPRLKILPKSDKPVFLCVAEILTTNSRERRRCLTKVILGGILLFALLMLVGYVIPVYIKGFPVPVRGAFQTLDRWSSMFFDGRVAGHLGAAVGLKTLSIHVCICPHFGM